MTFQRVAMLCAVATAAIGLCAHAASAVVINGTNDVLDANGREIYIPLTTEASGNLNADGAGLSSDRVKLTDADASGGYLTFRLDYDLDDARDGGLFGAPSVMLLTLTFTDMDFRPETFVTSKLEVRFSESLEIEFLDDPDDAPTGAALTIDEGNYLDFRTDGGTETDDTRAVYTVDARTALGVTDARVDDFLADGDFALFVRLRTSTVSTDLAPSKSTSLTMRNTSEDLADSFVFETLAIPEPGTLCLLALGGVAVAVRHRRRA